MMIISQALGACRPERGQIADEGALVSCQSQARAPGRSPATHGRGAQRPAKGARLTCRQSGGRSQAARGRSQAAAAVGRKEEGRKEGRKDKRNIWTRERLDTRVPVSTQGATLRSAPRGPTGAGCRALSAQRLSPASSLRSPRLEIPRAAVGWVPGVECPAARPTDARPVRVALDARPLAARDARRLCLRRGVEPAVRGSPLRRCLFGGETLQL